jgi:hypothetical protein
MHAGVVARPHPQVRYATIQRREDRLPSAGHWPDGPTASARPRVTSRSGLAEPEPPSLQPGAGSCLLAANQAMHAGVESVGRVFPLAGSGVVYDDQVLQRCWRDIHTANQHIIFSAGRDQAFAKLQMGVEQPTFLI